MRERLNMVIAIVIVMRRTRVAINSNSDDGNKNDNDTFYDAIQAEDAIDDTYNDNDNVNREPINNGFL